MKLYRLINGQRRKIRNLENQLNANKLLQSIESEVSNLTAAKEQEVNANLTDPNRAALA